jgi:hypothetical protein
VAVGLSSDITPPDQPVPVDPPPLTLRAATYDDRTWMYEAYKTWPNPKDFISEETVYRFLRRWIERGQPTCKVAEADGIPVGLITYQTNLFVCWVYNVLVVPEHRGKGYFKQMAMSVRDDLVAQGVVVAKFQTLPGPIEGRYEDDVVTPDTIF